MKPFLQQLPPFKGKFRIARLLYRNLISSGKDLEVSGKYDCVYKLPNLHENLAFEVFVNGIYEPDTQTFLKKRIRKNGVFLDLGANIGSVCIPFCKVRQDIKCVAVEAVPWIFETLQYNIRKNQLSDRITAVNKALFSEDGKEMNFYTDKNSFGKGSLSPVFSDVPIPVKTIRVDSLIDNANLGTPDFLKVDIEGYEFHAFLGASKLLSCTDAPDIFFEFADWTEHHAKLEPGAAQELLVSYGYKLYIVHNSDHLEKIDSIKRSGDAMIFASKREL